MTTMYRVKTDSQELLDAYYCKYSPIVRRRMQELLDGKIIRIKIPRAKTIVPYKVKGGSPTWNFLDKYKQPYNLWSLLCGSVGELLDIIEDVKTLCNGFKEWEKRITKEGYENNIYRTNGLDNDGNTIIDHFIDIMWGIFVGKKATHGLGLYENVLDKTDFIEKLDLKICPYCGMQHIKIGRGNGRISKPTIDHYLPKSKYPFLSMSFHNMIPCCGTCNDIQNKGDNDPISPYLYLENPYIFNNGDVTFVGKYPIVDIMDEKNYKVELNYSKRPSLRIGYGEWLKLDDLYGQETDRFMEIYIAFSTQTEAQKEYIKRYGIDKDFMMNNARCVIGHRLDLNPSKREYVKFNKDLYLQLCREFKVKP